MEPTNNNEKQEKQEGKRIKLPSITFIICLIISALVWAFLTFSRTYEVTMDYAITCSDLPEGKTSATCSDPSLALTFKTKGFYYFMPRFQEQNRTINLDIRKLTVHKGLGLNTYRFTKNELKDYIRDIDELNEFFVDVESPYEITIYLEN
ncbi:MAG: hypothetical protein IJP72_09505 [Bacteroidales bacterium]|nr:hypothetical protein [Bacteroidales bacterium]